MPWKQPGVGALGATKQHCLAGLKSEICHHYFSRVFSHLIYLQQYCIDYCSGIPYVQGSMYYSTTSIE